VPNGQYSATLDEKSPFFFVLKFFKKLSNLTFVEQLPALAAADGYAQKQ
jgi:hypothetical protein